MIIVTSLSPGHKNRENQIEAVKSWQGKGICFSVNNEQEIEEMKDHGYEGVRFLPTRKTTEYYTGKPLVSINDIIDHAIEWEDDLLIVNSDIILGELPEFKTDGITIFSRYDYHIDINQNKLFSAGFDVFYIPVRFLTIFPPSVYALGAAWFDYWIPYTCMKLNIPIYYPPGKFAFHKVHEVQYPYDQWIFLGEFFRWQFRFHRNMSIPMIATQALAAINAKLIR